LKRSGKVIYLTSDTPLPVDLLDIDGVHDLETHHSGRLGGDEVPTHDGAGKTEFTECTFTFTGDVNTLLERLPEHEFRDLSIEEAPLEDVFLRFYGERDV
jgi:ABC-2 type transport system ATP-binding protein